MRHRLTVTTAAATVLAAIALKSVVAGSAWFWEAAGAVAVVALAGTAARARPLPAAAGLAATLAALLLYLNSLFAGPQSWARLVPTGASLHHLWWLAGQGIHQVSRFAPPVPGLHGVLLLTVAGIGGVAALTDLLAVRLRRPALAGVPLLALFCVPETTSSRPPVTATMLVFCLGMAGYLALLSADGRERVRLWGQLVSAWQGSRPQSRPDTKPLAASGRRIGMAAVVVALFLPLLVPGLRAHRLFSGSSLGGGGSGGPVQLPDPLASLNQQLHQARQAPVLTYTTTDPAPPYLHVYVLDQLSDNAWTMATPTTASTTPISSPLPGAPGLARATPGPVVHETVSLGRQLAATGSGISYLPVPYPAQGLDPPPGNWRVDRGSLTVLAPGASLGGLRYRVTARDLNPSAQQLQGAPPPPAGLTRFLSVPSDFTTLRPLAARITADRTTAFGRAVALQQWFTRPGNFTYSLSVPQTHRAGALIRFLTKTRRGYCQQFAFAMAVLARLLGIPSRVVVGYTQGTPAGKDRWQVSTNDAHAWPELYFQGAGWLRFEPTPGGAAGAGQATASTPGYAFAGPAAGATPAQTTAPAAAGGPSAAASCPPGKTGCASQPGSRIRKVPQTGGGGASRASRPGSSPAGWLAAGLAVLLLATPAGARSLTRRRRWLRASGDAGQAAAAWLELRDDLSDHGITGRPSESPRALARRLAGSLGFAAGERAALDRVVFAAERARYARRPASAGSLRADVVTVRRAVARAASGQARWRARLLPPSALSPLAMALQHAMDVFGWLDRVTIRRPAAGRGQGPAAGPA